MKRIFFSFPIYASFVRNDEMLLKNYFEVQSFHFNQFSPQIFTSFWMQFVELWKNRKVIDCYVSFFAGYSSFLPGLFAKFFRKPHIIILGGTDCVSFPEINYGNFRKATLGWFTCQSLVGASRLAPVDESLRLVKYEYVRSIHSTQGYLNFCPNAQPSYSVIAIGYDPNQFFCSKEKRSNSFLTVAQMNSANFYRKGIDLIFGIAAEFPDCEFTVIGHDKDLIKLPKEPLNVRLRPFVPYDELRDIYSEHEFYLQLSMMEGFPSAPCEAMLCECIPIVSSVAALPHIVGDSGFILQRKSLEELSILIKKATACDKISLREKARKRIIENFSTVERRKLIALIEEEISIKRNV